MAGFFAVVFLADTFWTFSSILVTNSLDFFEAITTENETSFVGTVKDLEGKEFSDLSVMVFNQASLDSYMNYRWQWEN